MSSIFVVSPGGAGSTGGICRMVRDAAEAWNAQCPDGRLPMRVIDSGGMDRKGRMSWRFASSFARTAIACMTGEASLLHVHVATRGSVARKACFVLAARLFGKPAILHMHGADFEDFHDGLGAVARLLVGAVFRAASGVVVLGPRAAAHAERALGCSRARIHTLPNAVPASAETVRRAGAPHLVFLGALTERKGIDTLLEALGSPALRAASWRLTLVGNGDRDRWRDEAARRGIGTRVALPGWLPGEEARALLARADALLLPARQEAMPMVILEAMAAGVAVISTPVGEIGETVLDGTTGLLVPPGDPDALSTAIGRLLASPAERTWLGRQGQLRHRALFALDTYAERLAAIYARVMPDRQPALSPKVVAP